MSRLRSLTLQALKGATNEVSVEFNGVTNLTVIYGENGTGKSSLIDAFDVLCNNNFGSLDEKSIGTNKGKYLVNITKELNELQIGLNYNDNEWISRIGTGNRPTTTGPEGKPNVKILRREKILDFITKQPSQRYNAIKEFIETPQCERAEKFLNELKNDYEREYENDSRAVADSEDALERLWHSEGEPSDDAISWASAQVAVSSEELDSNRNRYEALLNLMDALTIKKTNLDQLQAQLISQEAEFQKLDCEFNELAEKTENNISELIEVIKSASKYITKTSSLNNCPVCNQIVNREELLGELNERLASKKQFVELKDDLLRQARQIDSLKSQLIQAIPGIVERASNAYNELESFLPQELEESNFNLADFSDLANETVEEEEKIQFACDLSLKLNESKAVLKSKKEEIERKINQWNAISNYLVTISEKREQASLKSFVLERIKSMHTLFIEERKSYVEEILENISGDIDRMYSTIHPGENLGHFSLNVERRASIELQAGFGDAENILPQAYYSESHLDTLGICLFIALAKLFRTEDTILILDDVITSADQVHLSRFLDMLNDELEHFQHTIITTHYQVWRDRYRHAGGNVQLIELLRWTLPRGIRHTRTRLYIEEIRYYLEQEPLDKQIVSSKTGILLELILDKVALLYQCKLPRKPEPCYTLGEFIGAFNSSLKRRLKIENINEDGTTEDVMLEEYFNVLPTDSQLRNQVGCHFNQVGELYAEDDITNFANNTLSLAEHLLCEDCGEMPSKGRTGTYYECKCNKKRLYPFKD